MAGATNLVLRLREKVARAAGRMGGLADLSVRAVMLQPSARKGGRLLAAAVLCSLLLPLQVLAAPKFPPLTGRVVDEAQILSPQTEQRLSAELEALERKTGRQLVVATLASLQGYEIEDYGYQLGRAWGIGGKEANDGVLLVVAPNERQVRIEVGYGLEPVLTDALSSLILQRRILPAFKAGDLEKGVVDGAEAIAAQLGLPADEARARAADAERQAAAQRGSARGGEGIPWPVIVGIVIVFWVLGGVTRVFGGRRRFGGSGLWWLLPLILSNSGRRSSGWSGGGGFSGGGGSFGGGGASGRW